MKTYHIWLHGHAMQYPLSMPDPTDWQFGKKIQDIFQSMSPQ